MSRVVATQLKPGRRRTAQRTPGGGQKSSRWPTVPHQLALNIINFGNVDRMLDKKRRNLKDSEYQKRESRKSRQKAASRRENPREGAEGTSLSNLTTLLEFPRKRVLQGEEVQAKVQKAGKEEGGRGGPHIGRLENRKLRGTPAIKFGHNFLTLLSGSTKCWKSS